ncbi:hypothetical protein AX14_002578 [Amanita brunnescens Koide BX004]|nr:hypothetical protein AX14_002578 [Amanita brunnescens Koide BX004]
MKRRKEPERYSTGSLIARIGFQPIEETLRVFFSRTLSMSSSASSEKPKEDELSTASRTLVSLLSLQVSLSLFLVTFIPPYLPIALRVLLPPRYLDTSAPAVLGAWVYYIPFLAINGGLEAFVSSVAKPSDLARQSRYMAFFSALYITTAVSFYKLALLGDASLVYANIVNLTARIAYCMHFANTYYSSCRSRHLVSWRKAIPRVPFLLSIVSSWTLVYLDTRAMTLPSTERGISLLFRMDLIMHICYGAVLALACIGVWLKVQGPLLPMELGKKKL